MHDSSGSSGSAVRQPGSGTGPEPVHVAPRPSHVVADGRDQSFGSAAPGQLAQGPVRSRHVHRRRARLGRHLLVHRPSLVVMVRVVPCDIGQSSWRYFPRTSRVRAITTQHGAGPLTARSRGRCGGPGAGLEAQLGVLCLRRRVSRWGGHTLASGNLTTPARTSTSELVPGDAGPQQHQVGRTETTQPLGPDRRQPLPCDGQAMARPVSRVQLSLPDIGAALTLTTATARWRPPGSGTRHELVAGGPRFRGCSLHSS